MNFHAGILLAVSILISGCGPSKETSIPGKLSGIEVYRLYRPVSVKISGLSAFSRDNGTDASKIEVYVDLLDEFGCRIKSPAVFRFALYEYVPRSSDPKGSGLQQWDDMELMDPQANDNYWKDYLRSYIFVLPLNSNPRGTKMFSLYITCITPEGRRISDTYILEYK